MMVSKSKHTDMQRSRLTALTSAFTKTDQILTGRPEVRVVASYSQKPPAPGWSDGKVISIAAEKFDNLGSMNTLIQLMGLNYHELSHLLYTPLRSSDLRKTLHGMDNLAFNVLEDQRIETLFTALYPPASKYFTEMVVKFFVGDQTQWDTAYMVTKGRRFLPLEIRKEFAARFILPPGDPTRLRMEEIIEEYRLMPIGPWANQKVVSMIKEFAKIISYIKGLSSNSSDPTACADDINGAPNIDKRLVRESSELAMEQTEEQDEKEEKGEDGSGFWDDVNTEDDEDAEGEGVEDEADSGSGEDSYGDDDGGEEDDSDEGDDDSDTAGEYDDGEEDADDDGNSEPGDEGLDESDEPADSSNGDSPESGHGSEKNMTDWELEESLRELQEAITESAQVLNDFRHFTDAMNDPESFEIGEDRVKSKKMEPPNSVIITARQIETEFKRLHAELEPGWRYGSDSGRLNVNRAINALANDDDMDNVFDEWEEGHEEEAGLEVVLALDVSGSMQGSAIMAASEALWIIKRSLDQIDAVVSGVSFGSSTRLMFERGEKVSNTQVDYFPAHDGSTEPANALRHARRILNQTSKPNKLFCIITDGGWYNSMYYSEDPQESLEEIIAEIPGTRVFIGVGNPNNEYRKHFDVTQDCNHPSEMVPLVKSIVYHMLANAGRNH